MQFVINLLAFDAAWFVTVKGAAQGLPWLGPVVTLAVLAYHLGTSRQRGAEWRLAVFALFLGLLTDSLLLATGWIAYPNGQWIPGVAPYWIVMMWVLFATTLNVSLRWLHGRPRLAALLGAVGGPVSYFAGAKIGAMTFVSTAPAMVALAIAWGVAMPLLVRVAADLEAMDKNRRRRTFEWGWNTHA
jgi:hypothetical protein